MDNLRTSLASIGENLLGEMGVYLPRLLGALLILIFGWLAAYLISRLVRAALRRTTIDNRIVSWVRGEEGETPDIEPTIGKVVFWFVMIFVFIAFFNALQMAAVTEPLQNMVESILGALPNVVKAAVLLLVAWLLATGLRLVVRKGLDTVGLDRRLGGEMVDSSGEKQIPVSHTLSETVYWLIFLLFLPAVLGALRMEGLLAPVQNMVSKLVGFIPNLFGAAVIFLVGWFIAKILRRIVTSLLAAAGLDSLGDKAGLDQALGKTKLSGLIGLLVYMLVLIPVLISALGAMELDDITKPASQMLDQILGAL
ncbi:MAG: mechanosensitive ion channel, partial [Acidobacteria bacterium]|nr:mechanosensitive ion channel [Acidobacteriota bacterium]